MLSVIVSVSVSMNIHDWGTDGFTRYPYGTGLRGYRGKRKKTAKLSKKTGILCGMIYLLLPREREEGRELDLGGLYPARSVA